METVLTPRELTVKSWKAWVDQETDELIQDNYGNYKGTVTFNEYNSEPVDATFKEQPEVGSKKYGSIEEYKTRAGKTRLKFKRADRPQEEQNMGYGAKSNYQPRDDMAIRAQWAIGQAVQLYIAEPKKSEVKTAKEVVENLAKDLYAMVDRVKNDSAVKEVFGSDSEPMPEMPPEFLQG